MKKTTMLNFEEFKKDYHYQIREIKQEIENSFSNLKKKDHFFISKFSQFIIYFSLIASFIFLMTTLANLLLIFLEPYNNLLLIIITFLIFAIFFSIFCIFFSRFKKINTQIRKELKDNLDYNKKISSFLDRQKFDYKIVENKRIKDFDDLRNILIAKRVIRENFELIKSSDLAKIEGKFSITNQSFLFNIKKENKKYLSKNIVEYFETSFEYKNLFLDLEFNFYIWSSFKKNEELFISGNEDFDKKFLINTNLKSFFWDKEDMISFFENSKSFFDNLSIRIENNKIKVFFVDEDNFYFNKKIININQREKMVYSIVKFLYKRYLIIELLTIFKKSQI